MRIKCHAQGKFYTIECPEGTRLVRAADRPGGDVPFLDHLVVSLNGKMIRIPADPPELLPLLAETGNFGITLVGEPEPDVRLAELSCLTCGEADVTWLQVRDESEAVHCDRCGADFALPPLPDAPVRVSSHPADGVLLGSPPRGAGSRPDAPYRFPTRRRSSTVPQGSSGTEAATCS
jgi:hypothetical protein